MRRNGRPQCRRWCPRPQAPGDRPCAPRSDSVSLLHWRKEWSGAMPESSPNRSGGAGLTGGAHGCCLGKLAGGVRPTRINVGGVRPASANVTCSLSFRRISALRAARRSPRGDDLTDPSRPRDRDRDRDLDLQPGRWASLPARCALAPLSLPLSRLRHRPSPGPTPPLPRPRKS
ncbi:hypothetical protein B0J12DRAFT_218302 [Macrophomina phaseolina]|uniref:Uncharacterized protein n=1 Tax=Macrophomina phaseolina TaxID=35725 RepID=A0ABQ8G263_9PEZI|nr:hypothetical protein B0J12DRAFT_218302 [Macrophomina phaseolina]